MPRHYHGEETDSDDDFIVSSDEEEEEESESSSDEDCGRRCRSNEESDEESDDESNEESGDDASGAESGDDADESEEESEEIRRFVVGSDEEDSASSSDDEHTRPRRSVVVEEPESESDDGASYDLQWHIDVAKRHFSSDVPVRNYVKHGADWAPDYGQHVRVGKTNRVNEFYRLEKGHVLQASQTHPGMYRVTVKGSGEGLLSADEEIGVPVAPRHLTPVSELKTHLNTMPTDDLWLLLRLVPGMTAEMVKGMQQQRPLKSWGDLRKRVPSVTNNVELYMRDFFAVTTSLSNATWRAFCMCRVRVVVQLIKSAGPPRTKRTTRVVQYDGAMSSYSYDTQLSVWSMMTADERSDAIDAAREAIDQEKRVRAMEREQKRAAEQEVFEPRKRVRRAAAVAADTIGYRESDVARRRERDFDRLLDENTE